MKRNMQKNCGAESKPRLSGGTLSVWTRKLGVSWTETVATQSGQYREWWKSTRLELTTV